MKVFAKRFFGFDPVTRPIVAFGLAKNRDALIEASHPGDLIVFVGTTSEPTAVEERGRLLGIAEFGRTGIDAAEVLDPSTYRSFDLKENGILAWPSALPMTRAWAFEPKLKLVDVLRQQLTFESTIRAVLLDDDDAKAVLALPRVEIDLPGHPVILSARMMNDALSEMRPTTGPVPANWSGTISRDVEVEAWTYAMQFGNRNIWKIGHARDLKARLAELNQHVPHEVLGERWGIFLRQHWATQIAAYGMEQRVLAALATARTDGERVRCSEMDLVTAWTSCIT